MVAPQGFEKEFSNPATYIYNTMIKLFTDQKFKTAKSRDLLPIICDNCGSMFYRTKHRIQATLKAISSGNNSRSLCYCNHQCQMNALYKSKEVVCKNCNRIFDRKVSAITKNNFCSQSCAAIYNNTHKTKGNRRSKLEVWIEKKLQIIFPTLDFVFNEKEAVDSELDIYIPSLKLAFELNGPLHYEPIYGPDKLASIQNNDERKFQACLEKGIEFCIIDVSRLSYFKETNAIPYLDMIVSVISLKLSII